MRRREMRRVSVAIVAVCSVLIPVATDASELQQLGMDDMIGRSDKVVLGDVVAQDSTFEGGVIWTHTWLRVTECLAGERCAEGQEVVVKTPGGTVGEIRQEVSGVTTPQPGQTLVLFLRRARALDVYAPVGMAQGVLRIESVGGAPWALRDLSHTSLSDHSMLMPLSELRGFVARP